MDARTACSAGSDTWRHVEAYFSPSDLASGGLKTPRLMEAIRTRLNGVSNAEVALIADLVRDRGPARAAVTLVEVSEVKNLGVIGVRRRGSEQEFPPEPFAHVYERDLQLGFHATAHAGKAAGAESIGGAIRSLRVERIGQGTRAWEDEQLLDYLVEQQIPLDVYPISNVRTRMVDSLEQHPARRCLGRAIAVTISTDDPKMFGNSLAEEYRLLEQRLRFSRDETRILILQGIRTAWLPEDRKQQLLDAFNSDAVWQSNGSAQ